MSDALTPERVAAIRNTPFPTSIVSDIAALCDAWVELRKWAEAAEAERDALRERIHNLPCRCCRGTGANMISTKSTREVDPCPCCGGSGKDGDAPEGKS